MTARIKIRKEGNGMGGRSEGGSGQRGRRGEGS